MAEQSRAAESELDQEALRERHALEDYRKAMHEAADAIRDQMRTELASQAAPQTRSLTRRERGQLKR